MPPYPLTSFEMQGYYQNEPRFNGAYSRNLPKIKDRAYVIKLDEYSDIGNHWIIPKEIKTFIGNKNIKTNIFRIQAYDSIKC